MALDKILARQSGKGSGSDAAHISLIVNWQIAGPINPGMAGETPFDIALVTNEVAIIAELRDKVAAHVTALTQTQGVPETFTAADVRGFKNVQHVIVTFVALEMTKAVTLPVAMPSANYSATPQAMFNTTADFWTTSQTQTGFTLNTSASIVGDVSVVVIED